MYVQGKTIRAIAKELGSSVKAVKNWVQEGSE
jgi:transposase